MRSNHYDIIIIGTGAGGGTLAHHLASSGKTILLLERGDYLKKEKENWSSKEVFVKGRYTAKEPWIDKEGKEFHPGIHYYVGGNTKLYGSALLRMREKDFEPLEFKYGTSPAWPISYKEMAPYYTKAEKLYHVHGERGSDPTEPEESSPYPYPPIKHEPRIQALCDDLKEAGHSPFPLPVGLLLDESNMESSLCIKCNTCDGFPCLLHAKADAETVCVKPALEHKNVTLLTNSYVERLVTSSSGKEVTSVVVNRNGVEENYKGDIVVVSCGAINSAALLLRSACKDHPNGLANGSGRVGRSYMCHNNSAMIALSTKENPTQFQKTLGINDFYFGADDWNFPLGHIQMLGKSDKEMFRADAAPFVPSFILDQMAKRSLDFWMTTEDLPDLDNRVTLTKDGNIKLSYTPNNQKTHEHLVKKLREMLHKIGIHHHMIDSTAYIGKKIPLAGTAHQSGTAVFGHDPSNSVLDVNCKAHEVDNLYVVDSSFFASSSSVNPSLTIIANALRVGDHLLERMG
jgi:choline dehydrogenase-like flavoprotein